MQLLSMGGVIGVGLFYGSGQALELAGPSILIDYAIGGLIVLIMMRALGEMTVEDPVAGSFSRHADRTMGPMAGFITGGMWWFFWVATVMSELSAIGLLVQYWFPSFPPWIPGLIALVLFTASNLTSVKVFGEVEFWFAVLKIFAIGAFIVVGLLLAIIALFGTSHHEAGFPNLWRYHGFFPKGLGGMLQAFSLVVLGYSGVETLAVTAGESENPMEAIPRAVTNVSWRILILYLGSVFIMLVAFPWSALAGRHTSPYVLLFARIGVPAAATIINAIIITSGLSSSNTGLYGGSRMIFSMSTERFLPSGMRTLNAKKVPKWAVWTTGLGISVGILVTYLAPNSVYVWMSSAASFAALWTWGTILVSEMLFRKRFKGKLHYPTPGWPVVPVIGLLLIAATLVAIAISPLTDVSVWSGAVWLVFLIVWWFSYARQHNSDRPDPNSQEASP
ncbi:amino acid permease [Sulfobacillus sp. DSM 109850]|uniref:Amino acid permease n=2 Tax=Sulfobacillus harzensis TaxID=2729629 RepID=A0A7Y0Q1U3_9FIRM|nr:amino acid permease [Sulfobacillus harzensis]